MTRDWYKLTSGQQSSYIERARFLIDRGYISGKSEEQLAKESYEKEFV